MTFTQKISFDSNPRDGRKRLWLLLFSLLLLLMLLLSGTLAVRAEDEEDADSGPAYTDLEIETKDGVTLTARLYDPFQTYKASLPEKQQESAKPSKTYPTMILLHQLSGRATDWKDLIPILLKANYAVVALDMRGHGGSVVLRGKSNYSWRRFKPKDWQMLPKDVLAVIAFLAESKEDYPELNLARIGIIGASVGANTAIIAGSKAPDKIKAVGLLSPGLNYKGLETPVPLLHYPNAAFFAASQEDTYSYTGTKQLYQWAQGNKVIRLYKNLNHGTDMLRLYPKLGEEMVQWMTPQILGTAKPPPKPDAKPAAKSSSTKPVTKPVARTVKKPAPRKVVTKKPAPVKSLKATYGKAPPPPVVTPPKAPAPSVPRMSTSP